MIIPLENIWLQVIGLSDFWISVCLLLSGLISIDRHSLCLLELEHTFSIMSDLTLVPIQQFLGKIFFLVSMALSKNYVRNVT